MTFSYSIVKSSGNFFLDTIKGLKDTSFDSIIESGGKLYGIFTPGLGLYSSELVVMFVWPDDNNETASSTANNFLQNLDMVVSVKTTMFKPTVRPLNDKAPDRRGLYIHRWMNFKTSDLEKAIALSNEAWVTFEDSFDSSIIGLFRDLEEKDGCTPLLLLTWYKDFIAWQVSRDREKDPQSWKNFRRRAALTRDALGIATNLWILDG